VNEFAVARYRVVSDPPDDEYPGATDLAVPVIDGIPLFERLDDRWPGIAFEWLWPLSGQWTGSPELVEYGRAVVLDGSCGQAGCCGVVARIIVGSDTVVWEDFYGHGAPEVPEDLRFEFARESYESELQRLGTLHAVEWIVRDEFNDPQPEALERSDEDGADRLIGYAKDPSGPVLWVDHDPSE